MVSFELGLYIHPLQQVLKARVITDRSKLKIRPVEPKIIQFIRVKGPVEPVKGLIHLSQPGINSGDFAGPGAGFFEFLEQFQGFDWVAEIPFIAM